MASDLNESLGTSFSNPHRFRQRGKNKGRESPQPYGEHDLDQFAALTCWDGESEATPTPQTSPPHNCRSGHSVVTHSTTETKNQHRNAMPSHRNERISNRLRFRTENPVDSDVPCGLGPRPARYDCGNKACGFLPKHAKHGTKRTTELTSNQPQQPFISNDPFPSWASKNVRFPQNGTRQYNLHEFLVDKTVYEKQFH